ncbi:peptidylprolyl isomerase [Ferviditalea candida]|uniref:peptidylprolyl isomerase n=1 Tax=Ferviditalea candida TaxID=3108399 RepID=A0ABU5ZMU5_9BACL|nr:peptidylprolyl isomerase [Paenibacillaceae bacterium T2]
MQISNRKWMIVSLVLLVGLAVYVFTYPPVQRNGEAVAKVNGVTIGKDQLYEELLAGGGKQALQNMIDKELIRQEAEKAGIKVTVDDIEQQLKSIRSTFPSEAEFQQTLAMYNMTLEDLKKEMESQVQLRKLLAPQIKVTDDDIKQFYNSHLEDLKEPEQVKASHILVGGKEEAAAILADLKKGADFAAIAKEKSLDSATKDNGGDLGFFAKGDMEEAFEKAAFSLPVGSLSDPVQTSNGYHIIKVTEHKQAHTPTLDEKKAEIREQLVNEQLSSLSSTWLEEKRAKAKIENYLDSTS